VSVKLKFATDPENRRPVEMLGRIRKLVKLAEWKRLTDISADSVNAALHKLEIGAQTRNHYRQHIKQFLLWCIPDRIVVNPLTKLKAENAKVDRKHDRQALSIQQQTKLIKTTQASNRIYGLGRSGEMDGPTRAMLYDVAFATGLRAGELRSLTRESFDLKRGLLTVAAAYSKHGETDVLPLPPWMVERLKTYFEKGGRLWQNVTRHTAKMLRQDLADAEIPYVVQGIDGPLFADFHGTRHAYVSTICQTEGSQKDQMEMTRHKSADLFLRVYAKTTNENTRRIAVQLPDPLAKPDDEQKSVG
jgi:integrase